MNSDWNAEISVKNQKLTETKEVYLNGQKEYVGEAFLKQCS